MNIDRQRILAVHALQRLGYAWDGTEWKVPPGQAQGVAPDLTATAEMASFIRDVRKFYYIYPQSNASRVCSDGGPGWHTGSHFDTESRRLLGDKV